MSVAACHGFTDLVCSCFISRGKCCAASFMVHTVVASKIYSHSTQMCEENTVSLFYKKLSSLSLASTY